MQLTFNKESFYEYRYCDCWRRPCRDFHCPGNDQKRKQPENSHGGKILQLILILDKDFLASNLSIFYHFYQTLLELLLIKSSLIKALSEN